MTFSRRSRYSQRANSGTSILSSEGASLKSKTSRLLTLGKRTALMRPLDHAALAVDELQLGQA